ncbi:uncharacterized protein LOC131320297 [Rhododendron vialii]|uniref:uncharacterized protein LOC131320297 n=1 Tax=Rhododendron vialii TaxID=182163 RepID=UPI00265ECE17|nr:uncharacterized protein LOC131320297 [Rhododendron vialii]
MAKPQEKQAFPITTTTPPIIEHQQEGFDMDDDYPETSSATGCGCFRLFRFYCSGGGEDSWRLLNNQRGDHHHQQHKETTWLESKLKDAKEFSEVVAGPKWKNFIRKLGKLFHKKEKRTTRQYDPYSYALNFDEGEEDDDEYLGNGYSSRFVAGPYSGDQERRSSVVL